MWKSISSECLPSVCQLRGFVTIVHMNILVGLHPQWHPREEWRLLFPQKVLWNLNWLSSAHSCLINQLIRTWQNDSGMIKLLDGLSKVFLCVFFFPPAFSSFLMITATVSNPRLGDKTKQFLISSSNKCQNPRRMEEADKVVIGKCPWYKQSEHTVILLCY